MSNIIPFEYNSRQVRTIVKDGEPWFVAADVCSILDIDTSTAVNGRNRISDSGIIRDGGLDDDEKDTDIVSTPGGSQEVLIVSEAGLYSLILKSRKPEAKAFKRWITHEVIPSIRKHGTYMTPETIEKVLLNPDTIIRLATELKQERQRRLMLEPKAASYDILMDASGCLTMDEVAKILDIKGIGRNNLFKLLVVEGIIYKKGDCYLPYQEYKSHFIVKQNPIRKGDMIIERSQLFMTPKGLDWLAHKLIDKGYQVNYYKGKPA